MCEINGEVRRGSILKGTAGDSLQSVVGGVKKMELPGGLKKPHLNFQLGERP